MMIRIIRSRSKIYLNSANSNLVGRAFSNRNSTSDANGGGSNSTGTSKTNNSSNTLSITSNTNENHEKTSATTSTTRSTTTTTTIGTTTNNTAGSTSYYSTNNDNNNNNKQRIPLLDMSPYLDPVTFCKSSSTYDSTTSKQRTMDGTLAAKRLNQGKQIVRDLIAYQLCNYYHPTTPNNKEQQQQQQCSNEEYILVNLRAETKRKRHKRQSLRKHTNTTKATPPQPFIISGHGIPKQLLKDHLNLCSQIVSHLQHEQIMTGGECFFHHSHNSNNTNHHTNNHHHDDTGSTILHVRNKGDKNKVISWPFSNNNNNNNNDHHCCCFQDRFALYLTVMNRISSTLVQIMLKKNAENTNDDNYYYYKIPHELPPQRIQYYPSYWNVHFAVKEDDTAEEENTSTDSNNTDTTTIYSDLSYRDPPLVIAQLSVRSSSSSSSTHTNSHYRSKVVSDDNNKSPAISNNMTNVRVQIHGREHEGKEKAANAQVSVIYEACFFSE